MVPKNLTKSSNLVFADVSVVECSLAFLTSCLIFFWGFKGL